MIGSLLAFNQFFIIAQNNSGIESVVESILPRRFENNRLGYATAMAMVLLVVIALVTIVQFFALRDTTEL